MNTAKSRRACIPGTSGTLRSRSYSISWISCPASNSRNPSASLRFGECLQHLIRVTFRLHFVEDFPDLSILADQKSRALDPHVLLPVHALLFPHAIGFGRGMIHVRQQRERQSVFGFEFFLRLGFVRRHAYNRRVLLLKLLA